MDRSTPREIGFARVLAALNDGQIASARALCQPVLRIAPDDPVARQIMATIALRSNNPAEAEEHIAVSLRHRPEHAPTLLLAGQIAHARGDLRMALERLDRAVTIDPTRADAAFARCGVVLDLPDNTQAQDNDRPDVNALLGDLLRRFPTFASGWAAISGNLERAGHLKPALAAIGQAANAAPTVSSFLKYAQLALQLAEPEAAAEALRRALQIDPTFAPAWFKLGVILQDGRRSEAAIDAYRRALALKPDLAEAAVNLGILLQENGDLDVAKRAYGMAVRERADTFGRVAQALTAAPKGELWMDLGALRSHLAELGT